MDLFGRFSCILILSTIYLQGGDCGTVQTSASVSGTLGSSVDLTCTYTVGPGDRVYGGSIAWKSKKSGTSDFENIALFSPPGEGNNSFTTTESAQNYKDRAELLNVTSIDSNTYRVVLRVLEVQCSDEREYQCFVSFNNQNTGPQTDSAITSLTVQAPAEQPYEIPAPLSSDIEENMNLSLSCTANVGKPPGKIKWWLYRDQISAPFFVAESSEIPVVQPGVCEYNVTFSIQPMVTKDDDQSVWRCSVDNDLLTSSPDQDKPNQETARINVFYKVDLPYITIFPNVTSSHYSIGSSVTLTCVAEGNPSPSTNIDKDINKYVWTFKANPGDNATELRSNNGVLNLNNLQETDTGTYTCTASNGFNGKVFNTSIDEQLYIVNTSPVPASTPTFTEGPTGNENTQPQTAEAITTTLPATTSTFVSPAGPAGNSDTEGRGSGDDGLSLGVTTVLMVSVLLIVIAILAVFTVWYNKLQKESVSHVEGTNRDYSVFMDENNKPIMFHRNHMIVTNQYRNL